MNLKKIRVFIIAVASLSNLAAYAQKTNSLELYSPNKDIKVTLTGADTKNHIRYDDVKFNILYKIKGKFEEILLPSKLGITTKDEDFEKLILVKANLPTTIQDSYQMLTGKRKNCDKPGVERVFEFANSNGKKLDVTFRLYNDGVAFRYTLPGAKGEITNVISENTLFTLPDSTERWTQAYTDSYEDFYRKNKDGKGDKLQEWGFPALFKVNNRALWMLFSEAGNTEFNCGARLSNLGHLNSYQVIYPEGRKDFEQTGVVAPTPWKSAWKTIITGSLNNLVSSTMITDVSDPQRIANTKWIIPGPVAWVYWANNHGSKDYQTVVKYVDLAKIMHWPYVLIDWEWDVMGNGGTVTDAINYAKSKGIKPMLWYNSGTTSVDASPIDRLKDREKRLKEFTWLNKVGVYGIKVDFFAGDQQDMIKFYLELLRDAADYHLMVNFHGATIPRGWARTYPNLMSTEAVYGAEWYNNLPKLTNEAARHNTTLPFTRNVIGSMDYTPVTFSNSQHPHITTYGHELALSVVFESAFQHFADRPEAYENLPDAPKKFLQEVPTAWDETRLLDGFPGKSVIIARRKGSTWYIGGLNGLDVERTLTLSFESFHASKIKLHLIKDGEDEKSFTSQDLMTTNKKSIQIKCLPRGGFVAQFNAE